MGSSRRWPRRKLGAKLRKFPNRNKWLLFEIELACHRRLDFFRRVGKCSRKVHQSSVRRIPQDVFDPDTDLFLRYVDSRFHGKYRAFRNRRRDITGVVHLEPDVVAYSMDEVLSQRLAVQVPAV